MIDRVHARAPLREGGRKSLGGGGGGAAIRLRETFSSRAHAQWRGRPRSVSLTEAHCFP